jgi:hypothetical protein
VEGRELLKKKKDERVVGAWEVPDGGEDICMYMYIYRVTRKKQRKKPLK